jgi:hypothetical protein
MSYVLSRLAQVLNFLITLFRTVFRVNMSPLNRLMLVSNFSPPKQRRFSLIGSYSSQTLATHSVSRLSGRRLRPFVGRSPASPGFFISFNSTQRLDLESHLLWVGSCLPVAISPRTHIPHL